ncbi:MAG: hypothetical protein HY738_19645, partial [Bacteroidia bacterium]|nr:hypothetical protein [Bacteroidia bacterium]
MKILFSCIILFIFILNATAQITLDSTNFPYTGLSYTRFYAMADTIGCLGENQHYNFSEAFIAFSDSMKYFSPEETSFAEQHPGAEVATITGTDFKIYYYYSKNISAYWESGITLIGDFGEGIDTVHGNNEPGYGDTLISSQYSYGYSTIQHSVSTIPFNPWVDVYLHKVKEISVDGWGSLSTGLNEFPDVLRIKYTEYRHDSVFVLGNFDSANHDTLYYYYYFAKGIPHPVVIAYTNKTGQLKYIEMIHVLKKIPGCTDASAINYNPFANLDDGSCIYCEEFDYPVTTDTSVCYGDSLTLQVSGGSSWEWSTGDTTSSISVLQDSSAIYSVFYSIQSNCWKSATINVNVNKPVEAGYWLDTSQLYINDSILFINASENATGYIWNFGDSSNSSTLTNPIYVFDEPGVKDVMLIAYNECFSDTVIYHLTITTIEETENLITNFRIYPNPG